MTETTPVVKEDAAFAIARSVSRTRFENLPAKAVELSKREILDTLACAIAGSSAAAGKEVVELGREFGGKPQSTVIAFGDKLPAPMAAFINATTGHALDFDDAHDKAVLHAGPVVVFAALATAEMGGKVDGKALITAVAVGADLTCRMGLAATTPIQQSSWLFSSLYGYFGATAAAGKILGLTDEQFINAFGIAYAQAAGNLQVTVDDEHALSKQMQIGFAAKGGVMAALLAQKGLTGARDCLEGRWGLYNRHHGGKYDRAQLLNGLGEHFEVANRSFKPYACCRHTHAHVEAALQIRRERGLDAKGHPDNPMSWDELGDKFRDCVSYSAEPLSQGNVEQAIKLCASLESVSDVGELAGLLCPA